MTKVMMIIVIKMKSGIHQDEDQNVDNETDEDVGFMVVNFR